MFADLIAVNPFVDRHQPGPGAAVVVLVAFLVAFLAIRTSARLTRRVSWWPGGIETDGGVHIHHLVFGICLMLFCGFLSFAAPLDAPWWHLIAIGFGVGAGFTLDESPSGCGSRTSTGAMKAAPRSTPSSAAARSLRWS